MRVKGSQRAFRKFLVLIVLLSACASGEVAPVDIEPSDMCSFCRMAISQKRFAAEIITEGDKVLKFDDIGCMLHYREREGETLKPAAIFVADHETEAWIKATNAFFIHSASVKTPMNGGILAFADESSAKREAAAEGGRIMRLDELKMQMP